jgi:hypothetical protein
MKATLALLAVTIAFLVAALAAGGLGYGGQRAPRPCEHREAVPGEGLDPRAQRFALRALDELACRLGKSREQLVLDLAERGIDVVELERRLRSRFGNVLERLSEIFRS